MVFTVCLQKKINFKTFLHVLYDVLSLTQIKHCSYVGVLNGPVAVVRHRVFCGAITTSTHQ